MGQSGAERRRRRALAATRSHAPQQPNKFVLPSGQDTTEALEAAIAKRERKAHISNRISKTRKGKNSTGKLRRRIQNIVAVSDALEVTIQWKDGTRKTFQLPKDGESDVPNGEKRNTSVPFNKGPGLVNSACEIPSEPGLLDERSSSIYSEVPEAQQTTSDLPDDTVGHSSPVALPGTDLNDVVPAQPTQSRRPSVPHSEIANSLASEDSFHDSQECPDLGRWTDTACSTRGTQTTPKAHRVGSVETPLGHSPELIHSSRDSVTDEQADQNISSRPVLEEALLKPPQPRQEMEDIVPSSPPSRKLVESSAPGHGVSDACSEASQELPALHDGLEHPQSTTQFATPYKSPRNKRNYDPYEIAPTPPKKRVLRSSGKMFATPPWRMQSEQKPQSAPGAVNMPLQRRSGLLRGESVVSEAELVAVFSDPDPEFDHFSGDMPKSTTAATSAICDNALAETSKGNVKKTKDETPLMPPRSRAVREWKDDKGEISDDSSYTDVMSTPLRNYGKIPRITSQRPRLISVEKKTPTRRTKMRSKSSTRRPRSVSKDTADRIAELPTSSTADSMASSPGSKASTKPTSPIDEAVSKPVKTAKPEQKPRRTSMSLVPGIPLSRGRRGSKSKPSPSHCFSNMTPSVAKETPLCDAGIRGSWASELLDPVHFVEEGWTKTAAPARIEIPIPSLETLASRTSEASHAKPRADEDRREEKTKRIEERAKRKQERKAKGESNVKETTNGEVKETPNLPEDTSKKVAEDTCKKAKPAKDWVTQEKDADKKAKPGRDWVAPEKRTPVPLPPYVAAMMGR